MLWGCIDDNSSELYPENNPDFSHITITSPTDTISVDLGQPVNFTPVVSQTIEGKALSYRWTANTLASDGTLGKEFECGSEATLDYKFVDKGSYKLKLEVKNEDYSEVKSWVMEVRTYDRGYFVVGNDDATGISTISFARELSATDILEGKKMTFAVDLLRNINPQYEISNVIRIAKAILQYRKSDAYLHIFTPDKIYVADPESFEIFWVADFAAAFPGEKIIDVGVTDTYMNPAYLACYDSQKGKYRLLGYNKNEFMMYGIGLNDLSTYYGDEMFIGRLAVSGKNMYIKNYWVSDNQVWHYDTGSGAISCNTTGNRANIYNGYDILDIFQMNGNSYEGQEYNAFAVCRNKSNPDQYMINEFPNMATDMPITFDCRNATYKKGMQLVPNGRYASVYYANGADVYVWYPKNVAPNNKFPTKAAFNIGEGKEVTFMRVSLDMRELYVGFYDRNSSEALKGGFYIYDASQIGMVPNQEPTKKFENITSRPVDIIYKTLSWDIYKPAS